MTIWLTAAETAARIHRHPATVRLAAVTEQLHGHQNCFGGRWVFHVGAVDAYVRGLGKAAQLDACCAHLRATAASHRR